MEFICDYMHNAQYRQLLNEMTSEIFGFSFEPWYASNCYEGEYIPFSFLEKGKLIANASANIMKMCLSGEEICFIQIGTVMTRVEYRNRGLAKILINTILETYKDQAAGFYLFGNLSAVGFYERLGFLRQDQFRWCYIGPIERAKQKTEFVKAGERDKEHYRYVLKNAVINAEFDQINRTSLQLFYTLDMKDVFYNKELDCFIVMYEEDGILHLDSIVSTLDVSIEDVLERVNGLWRYVVLGFTPKSNLEHYFAQKFDGAEDYRLFYIGEPLECITKKRLFFPILSHA